MRVFVTGVNGQLGHDVLLELLARGHEATGSGSAPAYHGVRIDAPFSYVPLELTDREQVERTLRALRPQAVIHCASWTAVDAAELPENRERVWAVNAGAVESLAGICAELDAKLLTVSTDYVFNGRGTEPWSPESSRPEPLNEYGASKLAGERAAQERLERLFIVRISWLFGLNGKNFVRTMLELGRKCAEVRVVDDQTGRPTYTRDLARLLADMIETEAYGVYHACNEGPFLSWADFAGEIFRQAGLGTRVIPVSTGEYGQNLARRPLNSRLDTSLLRRRGFAPLPDWRDALGRYLEELKEQEGSGWDRSK